MKKIMLVCASAASLGLMGSVLAQPYIGASVGYANTVFKSITGTTNTHQGNSGFDAGVLAGYEYKFDAFYLAGDVNLTGYNIKEKYTNTGLGSLTYQYNSSYGVDIYPGFYLNNDVKLFVLGGYQVGNFQFKNNFAGNSYSTSKSLGGWDLGLGSDVVLNDHFTLRLAYKWIGYSSMRSTSPNWNEQITPTSNQFNLSILYRFSF